MGQQAAQARPAGTQAGLAAVAAVAVAAAARLVYGGGSIGYDAAWALLWGREVAHGGVPSFTAPVAPTPHPLAILAGALLSPLGPQGAATVLLALSWLSLGALAVAAFALGRALLSVPAGVLFAALLLTRPLLISETRDAIVDIPFVALVLAAGALAVRGPPERRAVPALLAVAGLLRPEAWALSAGWWLVVRRGDRRALGWVLAAPLAWAALDLAVTGDPLHSLHGTRALAEQLGRPRTTGTAFSAAPGYLHSALEAPAIWLGLAGAALALVLGDRRMTLPLAVSGAALAGFIVLGAAGLPLLIRYLLLPAVLLALFAAYLALGWLSSAPRMRPAWAVAGAATLVALAVTAPAQRNRLRGAGAASAGRAAVQRDLLTLARAPAVRAAAARCPTVVIPDYRARPLLALALDRPPGRFRDDLAGGGLAFAYATARTGLVFGADTPSSQFGPATLPAGARRLGRDRSWIAAEDC